MFTQDELEFNTNHEQYYEHLNNLDLQVRLTKLYNLLYNKEYNIEKIKLCNQYSEEYKKFIFMKRKTTVILGEGIEPYLETDVNDRLFDIMNISSFSDIVRKTTGPSYEISRENFDDFLKNMKYELKIPTFYNADFDSVEVPLIKRISFGDIKDVPYIIYDEESYKEIKELSGKKEHVFYKYMAESMFNLFVHMNDFITKNGNTLHFVFSENEKGYRHFSDLMAESNNETAFVSQNFTENMKIFLGIVLGKTPTIVKKENSQEFIALIEEGLRRLSPLENSFEEKGYFLFLKTDLQKKIIFSELQCDTTHQKENKRRL